MPNWKRVIVSGSDATLSSLEIVKTVAPTLVLKSADTFITAGETVGNIDFRSDDTNDTGINARINVEKTPGSSASQVPMDFVFKTGVSSGLSEVLRLSSDQTATFASSVTATDGIFSGRLRIGTATSSDSSIISQAGDIQLRIGSTSTLHSPFVRLQGNDGVNSVYADIKLDVPNQLLVFNDPGTSGGSIGTNPMTLDANGNLTVNGDITSNKIVVRNLASANGTRWIITEQTSTGTGRLNLQAGAGSAGFGGGLGMYAHTHATNPGDVYAGISANSGGSFRVNSTGIDTGTDLFTVTTSKATFSNSINIIAANISNQENDDVDIGIETVATVPLSTFTAAFFDYVVKNGVNVRAGVVYACHDGTNVEYVETSTIDLGSTSDLQLLVGIVGTDMVLQATATSDNWSVKTITRAL
jgi:hypothetical protein